MKCDEIFAALAMLEKERGISQTFMMDKIIQALITAYKRDHEGVENVIVDVDEAKKDLKMFVQKDVVDEVENPDTQISLEDARAKFRGAQVGDTVVVSLPQSTVTLASMIVYAIPAAGLFLGMILGEKLLPLENNLGGVIGGIIGVGIPALVLYLTEKRRKDDPRWTPQLIRVIPAAEMNGTTKA